MSKASAATQDDDDARELAVIQGLIREQRFRDALVRLDARLAAKPQDIETLYMVAVCHRYLAEYDRALERLHELKALAPDHGRAHQEEGHTRRAMGDTEAALAAYARACQINAALIASWRAQIEILRVDGRYRQAAHAQKAMERVAALPKPLLAVTDLLGQGKLLRAEELCRQFLRKAPRQVEGMRLLAEIGVRLGVLDDAEFLLESAIEFDPDNVQVRIDYVQVLRKRQKFQAALDQAVILLEHDPDNPQFKSLVAIEKMQTGDYDTAISRFDEILSAVPGDPITLTSRGHALKTCGRTAESVDSYHQAVASQPRHGEAWYSLANLKTYRFDADEMSRMRALEGDINLSHMDRVYLAFALGKAHEDADEYDRAFEYYARGNALKKAQSRYSAEQMHEEMQAQHAVCTRELFEQRRGSGESSPDPVFVLGLPRAGSTLIEQILSSHSQIDGTLELPNILSLAARLRRGQRISNERHYPQCLATLTDDELREFGQRYIEDTRIHRQGAPLFVDKMPNNFRHIGLIKLILPNAKIIDARRHPMACCFSGFKQLFAEGQEFSYELADLGRYYTDYVELMAHWDEVLPGFVLRVEHQDVVDDLETQVRRMLDFCGLEFEPACLSFHETERNVRTPSSEQVRQPIYRDSLEQWQHFEPWLDPLKRALGEKVREHYSINLD